MGRKSGVPQEQLPLTTDELILVVRKGSMVKLTIADSRRGRVPWRRRTETGEREFLLTPGQALHAAQVLDDRGATAAADHLRSVVLARICEQEQSNLDDLLERLGITDDDPAEGLPPEQSEPAAGFLARSRKRLFSWPYDRLRGRDRARERSGQDDDHKQS